MINKFRGKYTTEQDQEDIDAVIRREVEVFLNTEKMTEANLVKLDQIILRQIQPGSGKEFDGKSNLGSVHHSNFEEY